MKKQLRNGFFLSLALSFAFAATAQEKKKAPKMLTFNRSEKVTSSTQAFQRLGMSSNDELRKKDSKTDKLGYRHEEFQQYYKGIKVEFGTYKSHSKNGEVKSINGDFFKIKNVPTKVSLSADAALQRALSDVGAQEYLWQSPAQAKLMDNYKKPSGELVVLPGEIANTSEARLAYKFDVYATKPVSRDYIYVDAQTGEVLFKNAIIKHLGEHSHGSKKKENSVDFDFEEMFVTGSAATRYSGSRSIETTQSGGNYILRDNTRGNGVETYDMNMGINYNSAVDFTDNDNNWTSAEHNNAAKDNAALDAHWGAEMTYDYFNQVFGRNSFNGSGAAIKSYVHFDLVEYGYPSQDNAFWNGSVMTYGDGTSFSPLTSIDVAAHEIGHAVCTYTADLVYSYESGAMNEGFSDIWAAAVEHFAKGNGNDLAPDAAIWLIGDEIGGPIRSMSNPNAHSQPDTYQGTNWYSGSGDNGGVHYNSGVLNHWFYRLTVGGSGSNDNGGSFNIAGIGIAKAAAIAYRLESVYLSSNSQYADARTGGIQAAIDLYGEDSPEVIATTDAFYAVGIGSAYNGGGGSDVCHTGDVTLSITFDNYPEETSWTLKDSSGATVDSASYSSSNPDGSTVNVTFSALAADDYTFTISDAYGDGICCSYGNGSYTLTGSEGVIVSGGSFSSSQSTTFCIEGGGTGGGDTQAPSAPTNVTASSITQTSATLSWSASSDNVGVTGYNVYQGSTNIGTVTGTSANITGLTASTAYTFSVTAVDAAANESASGSVTFTTSGGQVSYCSSNGNNSSYEWIDYVAFGGMTNTTGNDGGYADYTSQVATVSAGSTSQIVISAGFGSSSYTEYWAVWIDFNQDGTFADTEKVVTGSSSSSGNLTADITVPTDAVLGSTRMRVSMKYNSAQTACESFTYGEVEDYTVNITSGGTVVQTFGADAADTLGNEVVADVMAYPNPATTFVQVKLNARNTVNAIYRIVNTLGQSVQKGKLESGNINISQLQTGMYVLEVNDGQKLLTTKLIKK
ncbi:M4 family metallopeptidase [Tenacibaculum sp. IB213877]|uniref:M4 family metallopeptidase n=1 Tax=Tenacibaculum sp. IB213877 TaxID=3097351 RepID=UPI002A5AC8DD|nr:M4 family metallopeptidase [Tenacibaculum sp. IB213877]MDY0780505.1 M4 family metallopeptidase [Tenacibaculum sp. IB213877]